VVHGNVGRAIIELAKQYDASLIALVTQGLGGFQRMLMGSVADKLIRTAPMPVLVCPPPPGDL
jgi:nucleotide-binding universal stress UspA family protein